ncbi:MAG: hypothetical protein ACK559_31800, partial [bacterium]
PDGGAIAAVHRGDGVVDVGDDVGPAVGVHVGDGRQEVGGVDDRPLPVDRAVRPADGVEDGAAVDRDDVGDVVGVHVAVAVVVVELADHQRAVASAADAALPQHLELPVGVRGAAVAHRVLHHRLGADVAVLAVGGPHGG